MPKTVVLTEHARQRMLLRGVRERWTAETALTPEWSEPELRHAGAERRFRAIPDFSGRVLQVVCVETDETVHVITATWDRGARRKP